jgi:hypothetical protein
MHITGETKMRAFTRGFSPPLTRIGNVERKSGARQIFGAVAKAETDIKVLINRNLDAPSGAPSTRF